MTQRDNQSCHVHIRRQDMRRITQIRTTTNNIVLAVIQLRDPMRTVVERRDLHIIANSNRVGGTNTTNAKIALHMAIRRCPIGEIYTVTGASGFDN